MNNISISPRFFKTELNNYANHREALVRELIQNSVDSPGCHNIEIFHSPHFISVKDDGRGMSREILLTKYLSMGETTKEGGDFCGGFGKARTLTNFAQRSYEILSHDYKLSGQGSGYEIENHEFSRGCEFKIHTDQEEWGNIISRYLNKCSFKQNITVNGEVFKNSISRGRWARDLSFGSVWVNKSANPILLVRVNGITMFSRQISAAQVIIEINPEISREVLLSNRDSLVWEKQSEIEDFCNEIATESISALKTKSRSYFKPMRPGMAFLSRSKDKEIEYSTKEAGENVITFTENPYGEAKIAAKTIERMSEAIADRIEEEIVRQCIPETSKFAEKWLESTVISVETEDVEICKVAKLYDPEVWKGGETRMKLLKIWKLAVDYCAECYTKMTDQSFYYSVGWIFSEDCEAQCRKEGGINYILLSPLDKQNKMKYSVTKREDIATLLVLSAHEISHLSEMRHSEIFSVTFTNLMKEVMKGEGEIWRKVRLEK